MTTAPKNLLAVRELLLELLKPHGLSSAEVGIVGDSAHRGGYHCGRDRVIWRSGRIDDYSVDESKRDRDGLSDYASALDIGSFSVRVNGRTHNLHTFSVWLVAQCKAGTADTRNIREVIYSPDGRTVRRWDDLGVRSSGDSSHLWHTHISFYRDATKDGRDLTAVFLRYFVEIGLLDMPMTDDDHRFLFGRDLVPNPYSDADTNPTIAFSTYIRNTARSIEETKAAVARLADKVASPAPVAVTDEQLARALARPEVVAAIAKAVADEEARRMAA